MRRVLPAMALLLAGFVAGYVVREVSDDFWDADRCVDWGGAWDDEKQNCRYQ